MNPAEPLMVCPHWRSHLPIPVVLRSCVHCGTDLALSATNVLRVEQLKLSTCCIECALTHCSQEQISKAKGMANGVLFEDLEKAFAHAEAIYRKQRGSA